MESVFFDSNPSIRQFTDNASRANNLLHRTQHREMKPKTSKTAQTDSADMSGTNISGGDMMGGMDFGDNRGSGGDFEFTSYEQSEEQRELMRESARKYGEEQREIVEQEKRMTDFIKALKGEDTEVAPKHEENAAISPLSSASESRVQESAALSEEAVSMEDISGTENVGHDSLTQDNIPQKVALEQELPNKDKLQDEKKSVNPVKDKYKIESSKKNEHRAEKVDIAKPEKTEKEQPVQENVRKDSDWNSLLAFDDGFLIANLGFQTKSSELVETSEITPDFSGEKIEIPQTLDEIADDIEEIVSGMLTCAPSSEYIRSVLNYQMSPFGKRILKLCSDFGVKIVLKTSFLKDSYPNENFSANSACAYISSQKFCVLDENLITQKEEAVSARLFMAMAFDHALGIDTFSSLKSPAVLSNYGLCKESEPGHMFCDSFASVNPVNYFAQAVESFLRKDGETLESHIYNHEDLYDYDRSMYMYIDYLFKEMNGTYKA